MRDYDGEWWKRHYARHDWGYALQTSDGLWWRPEWHFGPVVSVLAMDGLEARMLVASDVVARVRSASAR